MSNHAIIVAAGAGKRFGGQKQFQRLHGRPLFTYATSVFDAHEGIQTITLVVPKRQIETTRAMIRDFGFKKVRRVVAGGKRRQDSVVNGLRTLRGKNGVAVIHDAVRPLVSKTLIKRGIDLCRTYKAVIPGVKAGDTVKRCMKQCVQETVPRDELFLIQTPQFYDLRMITKAIARADFRIEYTDEAAMLESLGVPIRVFQGDRYNIKVTDKKDMKLVEKLLS
ncbi:MAG: 2-C-methyl-D-erythritol 4-phosphate cytidylyltransferase [bacterium]